MDAQLGLQPDTPICVGGGQIFGPFNERVYLSRLRNPNGERVDYSRVGTVAFRGRSADRPLDVYDVTSSDESVRLFLDVYAPGPNGIPPGFHLVDPNPPWLLPTSIVCFDDALPLHANHDGPKCWRIRDSDGQTFGFVDWDGQSQPVIDLPPALTELMSKELLRFVSFAPPGYLGTILDDYFDRYLPTSSDGVVLAEPVRERDRSEWSLSTWGEEIIRQSALRRRFIWGIILAVGLIVWWMVI